VKNVLLGKKYRESLLSGAVSFLVMARILAFLIVTGYLFARI